MYFYKVYGVIVASDLEFPQLVVWDDTTHWDVTVEKTVFSKEIEEQSAFCEFGHEYSWLRNTTCQIQVYEGKRIGYALTGKGNPEWLQTYILGYGMSMLALQRDMLPIHCSVVADEQGAVMIAGESGTGKSTATTAFLKAGYTLMADDMAWADGSKVYPAFPYQKLCRDVVEREGYDPEELIYIDEQKDKFLARYRGEFSTEGRPIKGFLLLHLTSEQKVTVQEVNGLDRLHVFVGNLFLRKLMTREQKYAPYIGKIGLEMASKVPILCIGRPKEGNTAEEVVKAAFEWIEEV
ncbi:MAG: hypothetical protein IJZ55_04840 [Lachnospiraceae bacterium]|nr:hypothetical protein [Lachnospiraceae bacterium]